jgi:predicted nucleic acid-binding protein
MIVLDTNTIVPLFIRSSLTEPVSHLLVGGLPWMTEELAIIELSNVLMNCIRANQLEHNQARSILFQAQELLDSHLHRVSDMATLEMAIAFNVTAYDARFLVVAQEFGARLVTQDKRLRAAAPSHTMSIAEALESL